MVLKLNMDTTFNCLLVFDEEDKKYLLYREKLVSCYDQKLKIYYLPRPKHPFIISGTPLNLFHMECGGGCLNSK